MLYEAVMEVPANPKLLVFRHFQQLFLYPPALGDIAARLDDVYDLAGLVEDGGGSDLDNDVVSAGNVVHVCDRDGCPGGKGLLQRTWGVHSITGGVATVGDLIAGEAFGDRVYSASHLSDGPIGQDDVMVAINHHYGIRNTIQDIL